MTTTHDQNSTIPTTPVLYFSLELGNKNWTLAFTIGLGQKPRLRTIAARNTDALLAEIKAAEKHDSDCLRTPRLSPATRPGATASSFIVFSWPSGSRTSSSIPPASKSTAASAGPSPTASMPLTRRDAHSVVQRRAQGLGRGPYAISRERGLPTAWLRGVGWLRKVGPDKRFARLGCLRGGLRVVKVLRGPGRFTMRAVYYRVGRQRSNALGEQISRPRRQKNVTVAIAAVTIRARD
jgi:hypothetical protein